MTDRSDSLESRAVLALMTPELYRGNLFRVLNLPVDASLREVLRREERRAMRQRLGVAEDDGNPGAFPLEPPPTDEELRVARERLSNPRERLLDEFFWFWPTSGGTSTDTALLALEKADVGTAEKLWLELAKEAGDGDIAAHNLAVAAHLKALDLEARNDLQRRERKELDRLWRDALTHWHRAVTGEHFWLAVERRVSEINDVQLTTEFVQGIRRRFPKALLTLNARLAHAAAERGDPELTDRHLKLLAEAGFGDELQQQAIREALNPLRRRLRTAMDRAAARWEIHPQHGAKYVRELFQEASKLLRVVDALLPEDDITRSGLHDQVADKMLEGQDAFGGCTNDWDESVDLLELALSLARGEAQRARLEDNLQQVRELSKKGNRWCAPGYWDLPEEIVAKLESARSRIESGNWEEGLDELLAMDVSIGYPLHRCVASALNRWSVQINNDAFSDYNAFVPSKLRAFLDAIVRRGSIPIPNQHMQSWQLPACPCCGNSYYSQWVKGEHLGQQYWMCSTCAASDTSERESQAEKLRPAITEALAYVLLAVKVDGDDQGLRESLNRLKENANTHGAETPTTEELETRLRDHLRRETRAPVDAEPDDGTCFFCGQRPASSRCGVEVRMVGNSRTIELILGPSEEHEYAQAMVPRCAQCRDEHHRHAVVLAKWRTDRAATVAAAYEAQETRVEVASEAERQATTVASEKWEQAHRAELHLADVQVLDSRCDRCGSVDNWHDFLCTGCDAGMMLSGPLARRSVKGAILLTNLALVSWWLNSPAHFRQLQAFCQSLLPAVDIHLPLSAALTAGPLAVGLAVFSLVAAGLRGRRRAFRESRKVELHARKATSIGEAKAALEQAEAELKEAQKHWEKRKRLHAEAQERLGRTTADAAAEYDSRHPVPQLAKDVRPEADYQARGWIVHLREQGWHEDSVSGLASEQYTGWLSRPLIAGGTPPAAGPTQNN